MDYLTELGGLALGSRLKRLSERIAQDVARIYSQQDIAFEPRWFPVFRFLGTQTEASITDIAGAIDVTHPAVNQVANEMLDADLIVQISDANDKRRRLLSLSKKGKKLYAELEPTWRVVLMSVNEAIEESGHNLLKAIRAMEQTLDECDLPARFARNERLLNTAKVEVVPFAAAHREDFRRLNEAWIEKYFALEPADLEILSSPEKIIDDGGSILFARLGNRTVGTVALVKLQDGSFEIAKMAVDDAYQGMGIGRLLLDACIDRARKARAEVITLETNTKLASAVKLYKKAGFKPVRSTDTHPSKFSRVDLVMKLDLASAPAAK